MLKFQRSLKDDRQQRNSKGWQLYYLPLDNLTAVKLHQVKIKSICSQSIFIRYSHQPHQSSIKHKYKKLSWISVMLQIMHCCPKTHFNNGFSTAGISYSVTASSSNYLDTEQITRFWYLNEIKSHNKLGCVEASFSF